MKSIKSIILAVLVVSFMIAPLQASETDNNAYWTGISNEKVSALNLKAGESKTVKLLAEIPNQKTLKAYSVVIYFDETIMSLQVTASPDATMKPKMISSDTPGTVVINSFDVTGVSGKVAPIVEVTFTGIEAGTYPCSVLFTAFGESANNQFLPKCNSLQVNVK